MPSLWSAILRSLVGKTGNAAAGRPWAWGTRSELHILVSLLRRPKLPLGVEVALQYVSHDSFRRLTPHASSFRDVFVPAVPINVPPCCCSTLLVTCNIATSRSSLLPLRVILPLLQPNCKITGLGFSKQGHFANNQDLAGRVSTLSVRGSDGRPPVPIWQSRLVNATNWFVGTSKIPVFSF
jgi:hypothetical protein